MPEPILTESVTDLDAVEAGETEFAVNDLALRAGDGGRFWFTSVEAELRATARLGLRLEPSYASTISRSPPDRSFGLGVAGAWSLFHDIVRDLHLQAEIAVRAFGGEVADTAPSGRPKLPTEMGLRAGGRFGAWTIRPSVGVEAFGHSEHVPIWGGLAVLHALGSDDRLGFVGAEIEVDGDRRYPFTVAPNYLVDATTVRVPIRLGIAIPWVLGAARDAASIGIYTRVLLRFD